MPSMLWPVLVATVCLMRCSTGWQSSSSRDEAGSTASLFLVARLETVSRTTPVGSAFFFGAAFYLVLFAWLRRKVSFRRRLGSLQALVAALLLSAAVALEGGCGGGGGGKEARSSTGGALEVEVGLLRAEDVALRGSLTGAAVTLKGLPEGGLIGPRQKP